jgi:ATP-dependent helicase/DNAse subunit B
VAEDSPGIARHLAQVITQLKQAAVEPADFAARVAGRPEAAWMDRLVGAVYAGYQEALKASGAYDVPGLYWEAEARCRAGRPLALPAGGALLFDGFDDFTPSEFRLIDALRAHADLLAFGVHYDPDPARQDLFRAAARTVARIREQFDPVVAEVESPPPATQSEHLADQLFSRAPGAPPAGLAANVACLRVGDGQHEALAIARRVKALLRAGGLEPAEIAVVHPDPATARAPMRAAFAECGVPLHPQGGGTLAESAAGHLLARVLRAVQGWDRDAVLDVVCAPPFAPADPAQAAAFPYLTRHAAIVSGAEAWGPALASLRARLPEGRGAELKRLRLRVPDAAAALEALEAAVARLARFAAALPETAAPAAQADALETALLAVDAPEAVPDAAGWRGVWEVLGAMRRAPGGAWNRARFVRELGLALREAWGPVPGVPGGVVLCGPADLRNRRFAQVFLAGLNEGVFPRQPGSNAVYGEEDRARLARAGVRLESARDRLDRERLLLHHVAAAARDGLTLSHPLLKPDHREAAPSPFWAEAQAVLPGLPDLSEDPQAALAPEAAAMAAPGDWVNTALHRGGPWQAHAAGHFPVAARAAALEARRHSADPCDAHDGVLTAGSVRSALAAAFGPEHEFSVGRLEAYVACPFNFFQTHVLGIEEADPPEAAFDPRVRGIILHSVLQAFHAQFRGRALWEIPGAEAETVMRGLLAAAFDDVAWRSAAAPRGLREAERGHLETQLLRYLRLLRIEEDAAWKPMHFEVAFGHAPVETADALCTAAPLVVDSDAGPVRFAGRIDRVDLSEAAARIVDYKSGAIPAAKDVHAGRSLQCTVYAWAVEALLLPGRRCLEGLFVPVGRRAGTRPWFDALGGAATRDKDKWAQREETARAAIAQAVTGMREGVFCPPVENEACRGCGTARACRHETARLARKGAPA